MLNLFILLSVIGLFLSPSLLHIIEAIKKTERLSL